MALALSAQTALGFSAPAPLMAQTRAVSATMMADEKRAFPFAPRPAHLDGSYVGDVGFDPLGIGSYYNMKWMREAELKHGRVCMLAFLGYVMVDLGFYAPGAPHVSSLAAHDEAVKTGHMLFLLGVVGAFEALSYVSIYEMLSGETDRAPGDMGLADTRLNFMFRKKMEDPAFAKELALKELKNGRAAMMGFGGIVTASALHADAPGFPYF